MDKIDEFDLKILRKMQKDASLSVDTLADMVGLSRNACWRRMKRLEADGVINAKVALLDAEKLVGEVQNCCAVDAGDRRRTPDEWRP